MTNKLEILRAYQSWRRGEDDRTMEEAGLNQQIIGVAIDWAIAEIERARSQEPVVWINPADLARIITALPDELAAVSGHKAGVFTASLYADPRPAVPEGWRLVPEEPTPDMIAKACATTCKECHADCECGPYADYYRAMLDAAPQPPFGQKGRAKEK